MPIHGNIITMTSHEPHVVSNQRLFHGLFNSLCGLIFNNHQSLPCCTFVRGIHRWPMNSPRKGPVTRKKLPFDDIIMIQQCTRMLRGVNGEVNILSFTFTFEQQSAKYLSSGGSHTHHRTVPSSVITLLFGEIGTKPGSKSILVYLQQGKVMFSINSRVIKILSLRNGRGISPPSW